MYSAGVGYSAGYPRNLSQRRSSVVDKLRSATFEAGGSANRSGEGSRPSRPPSASHSHPFQPGRMARPPSAPMRVNIPMVFRRSDRDVQQNPILTGTRGRWPSSSSTPVPEASSSSNGPTTAHMGGTSSSTSSQVEEATSRTPRLTAEQSMRYVGDSFPSDGPLRVLLRSTVNESIALAKSAVEQFARGDALQELRRVVNVEWPNALHQVCTARQMVNITAYSVLDIVCEGAYMVVAAFAGVGAVWINNQSGQSAQRCRQLLTEFRNERQRSERPTAEALKDREELVAAAWELLPRWKAFKESASLFGAKRQFSSRPSSAGAAGDGASTPRKTAGYYVDLCVRAFRQHDERYAVFAAAQASSNEEQQSTSEATAAPHTFSAQAVPWPDTVLFALEQLNKVSPAAVKHADRRQLTQCVKLLQRRWHPDNFARSFYTQLQCLPSKERTTVEDKATLVSQQIHQYKDKWTQS